MNLILEGGRVGAMELMFGVGLSGGGVGGEELLEGVGTCGGDKE